MAYNPALEIAKFYDTILAIFGLISSYIIFGYYIKAKLYLKYYPIEMVRLKLKRKLRFIEDLEA